MLGQQRLDKIQHPKMKCNFSAFTSVRFQGTHTLFYRKGVNALMNSAGFFSETLHNDLWDTQGKFTVGPWMSHFGDSPNYIPLTFRTYWVFAEQRQFVVSDWASGFGFAADYSLHILSDEYFLDCILDNSSPFISIKKKKKQSKNEFVPFSLKRGQRKPHCVFWAHLSSIRVLFNIGEKPVFNNIMDFYTFTRLVSEFISSYRMLLSTILRHFEDFHLPSAF